MNVLVLVMYSQIPTDGYADRPHTMNVLTYTVHKCDCLCNIQAVYQILIITQPAYLCARFVTYL